MNGGNYVRVYTEILADDKFAGIALGSLGAWLRLLIYADEMYPAPAPLPRWLKRKEMDDLAARGLIDVVEDHYRMHGLEAERQRRSEAAAVGGRARHSSSKRSAFAQQTLSKRSANGMPSRAEPIAEPSRAEQYDAQALWYDLKAGQVNETGLAFVRDLQGQFGDERLMEAMRAEAAASDVDRKFLSRVKGRLLIESERQHQAAEKRRQHDELAYQRSLREAVESMTPEERERADRIRAGIGEFLKGVA